MKPYSMTQNHLSRLMPLLLIALFLCFPDACHATLESSLMGIKSKLTGVILPVLAVIGMALAALSFFTGNPNAKQHVVYAIMGCLFGFGSQALVDFISQTVH